MRPLKKYTCAFFLMAVCLQNPGFSYEYRIYNNKSGFEEDFIYTLIQDKQNFLWIGTINGLYRFDGFSFRRFTTEDGLAENIITSSYIDKKGLLYFGHIQGTVSVYDGQNFKAYDLSDKWRPQVISFAEGKNRVAALSRSKGIFIFTEDGGVSQVQMDFFKDRVRAGFAYFIDRIYVAHNEGLSEVNIDGETKATDIPEFQNISIAGLHKGKISEVLWILTEENGVFLMDSSRQIRQVISPEKTPPSLEIFYEDSYGCLWIGSKNYGLRKFRPLERGSAYALDNNLNENAGFPTNQVSAIIQDHENNYWVGSYDKGLIYIRKKTVEFYPKSVLDFEEINTVIGYREDQFLVGGDKGVCAIRYNPLLNKWIAERKGWMKGFRHSVTALHQGRDFLYVGAQVDGIYRVSAAGSVSEMAGNFQFKGQKIRKIIENKQRNLWVSASGSGVHKIDPDGVKIINFSTRTGFIHNEIYDLCLDGRNSLWLAMHANGLSVMNDSSKFIHLTKNGYLPARDINAVAEDRYGFVWVATDGQGIYKFNHKYQLIKNYTTEDNLLSDYCSFIIPGDDYIWAGYYEGVDRIDQKDGTATNFYRHPQNEFTTVNNTAATNKKGDLFIASIQGFNIISAQPEPLLKKSYKLNFTRLRIKEQEFNYYEQADKLMNLSNEENQLTFDYLSVGFSHPEDLLYSYRLNGSESNWSAPSNQRSVTFSSLSPGTYFFEIRSFPSNDPENYQHAGVRFKIAPPFYQRVWFILLVVAAGVSMTVFYSRYKTKRIINQKRELENLVIQRTRLINAQKEEILKTNNELKTAQSEIISKNSQLTNLNGKLERLVEERTRRLKVALDELDTFLYHASHDLKGPIARIKGLTLLSELENKFSDRIDTIDLMKKEGTQLDKTIDKLAKIHAVLSGKLNATRLNFHEVVQRTVSKLDNVENFNKVTWEYDYDKGFQIFCDNDLLEIILENLMENAITFQNPCPDNPKIIKIHVEKTRNHQIISVKDNGMGIHDEILDQIFGMYFRGSVYSKGNGLGLFLVKKSVDKLRGKITVSSKAGHSTTFTVSIPATG